MPVVLRLALGVTLLSLAGCLAQPPGLDDAVIEHLESVWTSDRATRVIYHEVERATAESLLPELASVQTDVGERLGLVPPRAEVLIYATSGPPAGDGEHVLETRCDLAHGPDGWRIRFRYPWTEQPETRRRLVGTAAHEVTEATVLLQVTALDPYLRWMHDGIAELMEHEVLLRRDPAAARASLARMIEFLGAREERGVLWADLTRWRQLASWIVRSHRFLGPGSVNLALDDVEGSLARVRRALAAREDSSIAEGLRELETILLRAEALERRPWAEGEARPDDPLTRDYVFYVLAFTFWLEVERSHPGAVRAYVQSLAARRAEEDHVLSAHEAEDLLRKAVDAGELPPLTRYPLASALATLEREVERLGR